jgi:hypothetical protein
MTTFRLCTIPPLCILHLHRARAKRLSSGSDLTASEPEGTLLLERETLVLLNCSVESRSERVSLALEVCGTGLNGVNQSERNGLFS